MATKKSKNSKADAKLESKVDSGFCEDPKVDFLPIIISKVEAVAQALYLEVCESPNEPNVEALRGLHWILEDAVGELKVISEHLCGDASLGYRMVKLGKDANLSSFLQPLSH